MSVQYEIFSGHYVFYGREELVYRRQLFANLKKKTALRGFE